MAKNMPPENVFIKIPEVNKNINIRIEKKFLFYKKLYCWYYKIPKQLNPRARF